MTEIILPCCREGGACHEAGLSWAQHSADIADLLGELANEVHAAVDRSVERGLPEDTAIAHLATLAGAWATTDTQ